MEQSVELGGLLILIAIVTFTPIFLIIIITRKSKSKSAESGQGRVPPGPRKLPIIGNLHQLAVSPLPHRRLGELAAKYGPLMQLQLGEISAVVVSSAEFAKEIMQTHDLNFATRYSAVLPSASIIFYGGRDIAFAPYGEYWREMRKICTVELLSPQRVRSLQPIIEEEIKKLIGLVVKDTSTSTGASSSVNLSRMLTCLGNSVTCRSAFGIAPKQEEVFLPFLEEIVKELGGFSLGDLFPSSKLVRYVSGSEAKLEELHRAADAILQTIITDHVAKRSTRKKLNTDLDLDLDLDHVSQGEEPRPRIFFLQ